MKDFVKRSVEFTRPYDTYSFLQGFLAGAEAFAIWKNGEQLLGIGNKSMRDLKQAVKEYTQEQGDSPDHAIEGLVK